MYNEEIKVKFINGYSESINTKKVCATIFEAFAPYEQEWNADLCTKGSEELQPVIDSISGLRSKSKWMRFIILKDYVKWCIAMNVPNACDGMLKITTTGLDKMKHQTVSSPLQLQMYLDSIFDPESAQTVDNIYRCYYWLAYGGVDEEDILNIKCSDVDLSSMTVYYKDTEVPIYREALPSFKNSLQLTQFVYKHPLYNKVTYRDRAAGDTLIRGTSSQPVLQGVRVTLSRQSKKAVSENKTDLQLSYFRVWLSGLFYRMYERERAGIPADFTDAAELAMRDKNYKNRRSPEVKRRQLARDYLEDYNRWKLAFKI